MLQHVLSLLWRGDVPKEAPFRRNSLQLVRSETMFDSIATVVK
uniref:Uncharacterized protein n=1 Tax=Arundo donax TaxID=35708 RepID=A0A0A8ZEX4_ARUDO